MDMRGKFELTLRRVAEGSCVLTGLTADALDGSLDRRQLLAFRRLQCLAPRGCGKYPVHKLPSAGFDGVPLRCRHRPIGRTQQSVRVLPRSFGSPDRSRLLTRSDHCRSKVMLFRDIELHRSGRNATIAAARDRGSRRTFSRDNRFTEARLKLRVEPEVALVGHLTIILSGRGLSSVVRLPIRTGR